MKSYQIKQLVLDAICFGFIFCILIIAFTDPTDEQWLNLSSNTAIVVLACAAGATLSQFLNSKNIQTMGASLFDSGTQSNNVIEKPFFQKFSFWQLVLVLLFLFVAGIKSTEFTLYKILDIEGIRGAGRIFAKLLNPNFDLMPSAVLKMFETVFMAFLATALAIPIAFVMSFFSAKNIMQHPLSYAVYLVLRTGLNVVRSVESFMWAIIFSVWVGIGASAGMLALMIHSIASLAKQYSEIIEGVSDGPIESIRSTGASKIQTIWFGIVPQVVLPFISFTVYRWDINVRMATIVGFVGGGGIGKLLIAYQGQAMWEEVGCIFFVIAIVVWLLDQGSAYIREALK